MINYYEREWRSVSSFSFNAIAMLMLPKNYQQKFHYFDDVVSKQALNLNFIRRVPIFPWKDLPYILMDGG